MNVLDLFSGIGGFSLGLSWASFKTIAFCEIDSYCQKVLNKNFPNVPIFEDIKELTKEKFKDKVSEPVDLICGGFPCQPFSQAGKKKGKSDDRYLWPEMFRVIREIRPSWVIAENVNGFVTMGLQDVLNDLESQGFQCQPFIIPACALGAPHERKRVWIVAYSERNKYSREGRREPSKKKGMEGINWEKDSPLRQSSGTSSIWMSSQNNVPDTNSSRLQDEGSQLKTTGITRVIPNTILEYNERNENNRKDQGTTGQQNAVIFERPNQILLYDSTSERLQGQEWIKQKRAKSSRSSWTQIKPEFCGMDDGLSRELDSNLKKWESPFNGAYTVKEKVPNRNNRLKGLGNAVIPQIPYILGKYILEVEKLTTSNSG